MKPVYQSHCERANDTRAPFLGIWKHGYVDKRLLLTKMKSGWSSRGLGKAFILQAGYGRDGTNAASRPFA